MQLLPRLGEKKEVKMAAVTHNRVPALMCQTSWKRLLPVWPSHLRSKDKASYLTGRISKAGV